MKDGDAEDVELRLARYFSTTAEFWVNLQCAYDLDVATRASADGIKCDVHPREAARRPRAIVIRCADLKITAQGQRATPRP